MERIIKDIGDITYKSELILSPPKADEGSFARHRNSGGLRINSHSNLCSLAFHKLRAH